jgi:hypothetical protein
VNRDRFIVRLLPRSGLYPNLEEFAGLTSHAEERLIRPETLSEHLLRDVGVIESDRAGGAPHHHYPGNGLRR